MGYQPKFAVHNFGKFFNDRNEELMMGRSSCNTEFAHRLRFSEGKARAVLEGDDDVLKSVLEQKQDNCDPLVFDQVSHFAVNSTS